MTQKIDMTREGIARREAEIIRRMDGISTAGQARAAARKRIAAEVEAEELATLTVAKDRADADAERARIAAVVKLGRDRDRGRQALRAALLAPIGADAASGLIAALPRDDQAAPEAIAIPGFMSFGSPAAQAERRRITSAFARPEAEGRFDASCALILDSDAGLTGEQIAPLLSTMPIAPVSDFDRFDIGKRAEGLTEIGGDFDPIQSRGERVDALWSRAINRANSEIGAAPAPTAAPASPEMGSEAARADRLSGA